MRVLVTGGAGFIGSHLCEALVAEGHSVRVLDNLFTGSLENLRGVDDRIEFNAGSVLDPVALRSAMRGVGAVLHLAAVVSVRGSVACPMHLGRVNVEGTLATLSTAREAGVRRFVLASSCAVYGDQDAPRQHEDLPPRPISPYGASKASAEQYAFAFHRMGALEAVALRFFNVYGPRQAAGSPYAAVIPTFIAAARSGRRPTVYGDGTQRRDFIFVGDVVAGCLAAMTADGAAVGETINLATGRSTSINALLDRLRGAVGRDFEVEHAPPVPGEMRDSAADVAKARRLLGFEAKTDLGAGLAQVLDGHTARVVT